MIDLKKYTYIFDDMDCGIYLEKTLKNLRVFEEIKESLKEKHDFDFSDKFAVSTVGDGTIVMEEKFNDDFITTVKTCTIYSEDKIVILKMNIENDFNIVTTKKRILSKNEIER